MNNITTKKQLFFDFGRDYDADLDNFFFSHKNNIIRNELIESITSKNKKDIFISGLEGSGKTFLLKSLLNHQKNLNKLNIYIDLSELDGTKKYFTDLNKFNYICLDNVEKANSELQLQIFNLINECKNSSTNLLKLNFLFSIQSLAFIIIAIFKFSGIFSEFKNSLGQIKNIEQIK